jgi:hypothetical protein
MEGSRAARVSTLVTPSQRARYLAVLRSAPAGILMELDGRWLSARIRVDISGTSL